MSKKLKSIPGLFLLVFLLTSCREPVEGDFAIYLLKEEMHASELVDIDLAELALQETPLISIDHIVSYDGTDHSIELTQEGYARIQELFPTAVWVSGTPFVVTVGDERIYTGAFWSPFSSLSFDGVVIMQELSEEQQQIQISLGYPGPDWFSGEDPRSDRRILTALSAAGKLKE